MLITTQNLKKVFSSDHVRHAALRGIDLQIDKGEFVVVAGPSGSGKTTLLNILGTLDVPTEGKVFLKDRDVGELKEKEKTELRLRTLGFVFQAYNLVNVLSALENVEYVLLLQGVDKKKRRRTARELLHAVGLEGKEDRRPAQLSGGEQQRVAVARSLASQPELVLADEPTANLDQATGKELIELMLGLNKERGITFVIASHDHMVIEHARRLLRLLDGRVVVDEVKN
jgi:putative ABC transport system ATP-binding protein